jgi:predicted DNA-binding antitoxin AbrB/MazE fold protein
MTTVIEAVYENGVFKPKSPVDLAEKSEVRLLIESKTKLSAAIQLLNSWLEGDEQEQKETWLFLKRALDEDRPSNRKLFSP